MISAPPSLRIAISLIPIATTVFGGLSPEEAAGRKHYTVEVSRVVSVKGPVSYTAGLSVARHNGVYGVGILPAGVLIQAGSWDVAVLGGVWRYTEPVPVPGSRRVVFSGRVEIGRRISRLRVASVFEHISNANTGDVNPGYNGLGASVGFSW